MNTKTCKDCGVEYPKTNEFFHRNGKSFRSRCRPCQNIRKQEIYLQDREKISEQKKKHYQNNKEKIKKQQQEYRLGNKEKKRDYDREYRIRNKEKKRKYDSLPENKKRRNERRRIRRRKDPCYRMKCVVSNAVWLALKKSIGVKGCPTWDALPYTPQELREHIESQFEDWMTWENYGNGEGFWNIDHIIPQSKLLYDSFEHPNFQKCWALENLQPLCSIENSSKGNRTN